MPLRGMRQAEQPEIRNVIGEEMPQYPARQGLFILRRRFEIRRKGLEVKVVFFDVHAELFAQVAKVAVEGPLVAGRGDRGGHGHFGAVGSRQRAGSFRERAYRQHDFRELLRGRLHDVEYRQMPYLLRGLIGNVVPVGKNRRIFSGSQVRRNVGGKIGSVGIERHFHELSAERARYGAHCLAALVSRAGIGYDENLSGVLREDFKKPFNRLFRRHGNLLPAAPDGDFAQPPRRIYHLREREPAYRANRALLVQRRHSRRHDPSVLYAQQNLAVLRAHRAAGLHGFVGLAEPLPPPVGEAAGRAGVYARPAKQAFFRAPRPPESRGNLRLLAAVCDAYGGLGVDFLADPETPAAQNAKVVVLVYERIVALDLRGVVYHGEADVARIRAEGDFAQLAARAVGARPAAGGGSRAGGRFLLVLAVRAGVAYEARRRVGAHHQLYRAPPLGFELFGSSAHNHSLGGRRRAGSGGSAHSVDFHDA